MSIFVEYGKEHWATVANTVGMTIKHLASCPTVYAGFAAHAIISGCVGHRAWIIPTGEIVSVLEMRAGSKVTVYENRDSFDEAMNAYKQFDREMAIDPETGRHGINS